MAVVAEKTIEFFKGEKVLLSGFLKHPSPYPNERVQIFIDGANLYRFLKEECGSAKLDFLEFARRLCNGRKLVRINYYISTVNPQRNATVAANQQRFLNKLRNVPYVTISHRPLRYAASKSFEKGLDVLMATDIITNALRDCYDTAILVSGDGDFAPVLDEVKRAGKQVENAAFQSGRSDALINTSDRFIELDKHGLKGAIK